MLDKIEEHARNLSAIIDVEGEEGQFEYLIDVGKIRHSLVICAFKFFDSYSK